MNDDDLGEFLIGLFGLAVWAGIAFIVIHFILKFW